MSRRSEQLASVMLRAVQSVLTEGLADPRYQGVVTITSARVTNDHMECILSVSVLPERNESKVLHALADAAGYIRREAGELMSIHHAPKLVFKLDKSLKREATVLNALAKIREEENAAAGTATLGDPSPPSAPSTLDHDTERTQ